MTRKSVKPDWEMWHAMQATFPPKPLPPPTTFTANVAFQADIKKWIWHYTSQRGMRIQ
ncbi:MAG: hypothetical protein ACXVXN_02050 [Mycobacteriaceae bacterium]